MSYQIVKYKNIEVSFLPSLDGGGTGFGQQYVPVVRNLFGKVNRVYEFCCGPGFIGFALLAEGLCDSLCLSDINPKAIECVRETITKNNLQDKVSVYTSDALKDIPDSEKWDLVVSNPPHFYAANEEEYQTNIRLYDPHWEIHKNFYTNVKKFLAPNGSVFIQENYEGSTEELSLPLLKEGGLEFVDSVMHYQHKVGHMERFYFVWSMAAGVHAKPKQITADFLISAEKPVEIISVVASSKVGKLNLKIKTRYRLAITNNFDRDIKVAVYRSRCKVFERKNIDLFELCPQETKESFVFNLGPGDYLLKNEFSGKTLTKITVR